MIELIDETSGRSAKCEITFHGQAATEISSESLIKWARKIGRYRFFRRALIMSNCCDTFYLSTPSEFACGLYVSNFDGVKVAWVGDAYED